MKKIFAFILSSLFAVSALFAEDVTLSFDKTSSRVGVTFNVSSSSEFPHIFRIENIDNANMYRLFDGGPMLADYKGIEVVFNYDDFYEIPEALQFFFSTDAFGRGYYPYVVEMTTTTTLNIDFTNREMWPNLWTTSSGDPVAANIVFNRFGFRSNAPRRQSMDTGELLMAEDDESYIMDVKIKSMALIKLDDTKEYFDILGGGMYGANHAYRMYGESVSVTLSNVGELIWDISAEGAESATIYLASPLDANAAANLDILVDDYDVPSVTGIEEGSTEINIELENAYQLIVTTWGSALTLDVEKIVLSAVVNLTIVPDDEIVAQALPVGVSTLLKAKFTPSTVNHAVTWSSSNESIATVDVTGLVTGMSVGNAVITVVSDEDPSLTATYTVTVTGSKVDVIGVTVGKSSLNVKLLNTASLSYTVYPANATIRSITWSSADESIATVDNNGIITPVNEGTTNIIVTTVDGGFTAACAVTVIGFQPIPLGYTSLYALTFNNNGAVENLSTANGATVPAIFSSNGASLLGTSSNWNRNSRYVDLLNYRDLDIACYFQTEDVGKTITLRYVFAGANSEDTETALDVINTDILIVSESQILTIDLANDPLDVEKLRRLGAVKFRNASGEIKFNIDYVALRPNVLGIGNVFMDELPAFVNVYNIMGQLIKSNVARESALDGLTKGIYIVNNKKVIITH